MAIETTALEIQPCPECGVAMVQELSDERIEYKSYYRTIQIYAWWCEGCAQRIVLSNAANKREIQYLKLKAEVDGVLGPEEVAVVRKKLGLSQRKASELLGGGPRSFQKYESGRQSVSAPMSNLLLLLNNEPRRLKEIVADVKRRSTIPPPPDTLPPELRLSKRKGAVRRCVASDSGVRKKRKSAPPKGGAGSEG